jgi:hypothetical protein
MTTTPQEPTPDSDDSLDLTAEDQIGMVDDPLIPINQDEPDSTGTESA